MNVPEGYCQCGCGQKAPTAKYNFPERGWVKGQPKRFIHNHHMRGARNNHYNMGLSFHKGLNRWRVICRDGSTILFARAVMEGHLKRRLLLEEVVHHINGDSSNDRIENLQLFASKSDHRRIAHGDYHPPTHFAYTKEDLTIHLRELAERLGRVPVVNDLQKPGAPRYHTYVKRFGSWAAALKEVGLRGL